MEARTEIEVIKNECVEFAKYIRNGNDYYNNGFSTEMVYNEWREKYRPIKNSQPDLIGKLKEALGFYEPYDIVSVLKTLTESSEELLQRHNYDGHGHEIILECVKRGKEIIKNLQSLPITTELATINQP